MLGITDLRGTVMVGTRTTSSDPNNIVKLDVRTPQTVTTLTQVNAQLLAGKKLATTEEIWYTSVDASASKDGS